MEPEPEVQPEGNVAAGPVDESSKVPEPSSAEVVVIPENQSGVETLPPSERKVSTEDPSAIIESLRARLLSERNSSKAAKQQAQHLARKVKELERGLEAEVERRKECETLIQELILKLDKAGVKVDGVGESFEEESGSRKVVKPSWISVSARRSSSDGSLEVDVLNDNNINNNGEQESTSPLSPPASPVSETSLVTRRVGRSCRTVRRKELWDLEIDEQVKGNWSKVGADITEIAKLRDVEACGSESGWLSRVVDMVESKTAGSWNGEQETSEHQNHQRTESSVDTELGSSNNNVEDNSSLNGMQSDASTSNARALESQNEQMNVVVETTSSVCVSPSSVENSAQVVPEPDDTRELQVEHRQPSSAGATSSRDDVEDILRALRLAKLQLRSNLSGSYAGAYSPVHRSFQDLQASDGLVTRPLAQFIPASHEFRIQRSRSQHSYLSFANLSSSPGRF